MKTGRLYIVATPIGNLEDITLRALRVLKEVDVVAAEDTRRTRGLLTHFGISKRVMSCHEHNEMVSGNKIVSMLNAGASVALVSDAGSPGISDPGYRLVNLAVENAIPVEPVPGASALIALLSVSGVPTDSFTFKGFVPARAGDKRAFFNSLKPFPGTYVVYESPRRVMDTLQVMREALGETKVVLGRELTKMHEEVLRANTGDIIRELEGRLGGSEPKGEVTLVFCVEPQGSTLSAEDELKRLLQCGTTVNDAAKAVALATGRPKAEVYKLALRAKEAAVKKGGKDS